MDQGLIPRRYAKALYEVAVEKGTAADLYTVMQRLSAAFAAEPRLGETMANPFVADADKIHLIDTAAEPGSNATFGDFTTLLRRNGRLDMARDIANAFIDLYRRQNHIYKVTVESAAPLADDVRKRITALIQQHIGNGTLECTFEVVPSLIGGFKIRLGNELLDASVATQLNNIRLELIK